MKILRRFLLIINTIRYLKFEQLIYLFYYRIIKPIRPKKLFPSASPLSDSSLSSQKSTIPLNLQNSPIPYSIIGSLKLEREIYIFSFLNIQHSFSNGICWNFNEYGKLWEFNLSYFDFLFSENCNKDIGLFLIKDFILRSNEIECSVEPYSISLRNVNWIKFLIYQKLDEKIVTEAIRRQYDLLYYNIEYHLMGNHLLENGFSLLFGGYYLNNRKLYKKGKKIILRELARQILPDGGHFEQSPMYHHIILYRLLDTINLIKHNPGFNDFQLLGTLILIASSMLTWVKNISFSDGSFPCFNDASLKITLSGQQLIDYANSLEVSDKQTLKLNESGYRLWRKNGMEVFMDIGNITASYQPGHTHADTFTFCLHNNGKPVIVDTGISTYNASLRRQYERSTSAHNVLVIDDFNSSEVWGVFRLGKRAKVKLLKEDERMIIAEHNGYNKIGCIHQRTFIWESNDFIIEDVVKGKINGIHCFSYLHFHPECKLSLKGNKLFLNGIVITLDGFEFLSLETYYFCEGYNLLSVATRLKGIILSSSRIHIKRVEYAN